MRLRMMKGTEDSPARSRLPVILIASAVRALQSSEVSQKHGAGSEWCFMGATAKDAAP